jgi:hypothetical protein
MAHLAEKPQNGSDVIDVRRCAADEDRGPSAEHNRRSTDDGRVDERRAGRGERELELCQQLWSRRAHLDEDLPVCGGERARWTPVRGAHRIGPGQAGDNDLGVANRVCRCGDNTSDPYLLRASSSSVPEGWLEARPGEAPGEGRAHPPGAEDGDPRAHTITLHTDSTGPEPAPVLSNA